MIYIPHLTDRQKDALRPFVQEARNLDRDGFLGGNHHINPGAHFRVEEWLRLLYAFDADIPTAGNNL